MKKTILISALIAATMIQAENAAKLKHDCYQKKNDYACVKYAYTLDKKGDTRGFLRVLQEACIAYHNGDTCHLWSLKEREALNAKKITIEEAPNEALYLAKRTRLSPKKVLKYTRIACEGGLGEGCIQAAVNEMMINNNEKESIRLTKKGCSMGHADSCLEAAIWTDDPFELKMTAETKALLKKGCKLGNKLACDYYKNGIPVESGD